MYISSNKILSFIIALKRFKNNSVILKKAKYKMAQQVGLHPNTFTKYLKEAIACGYIYEDDSNYSIIALQDILKDFNKETGLVFLSHDILLSKDYKFKNVEKEIEYALITDNVYHMQEKALQKKERFIYLAKKISQTGKSQDLLSPKDFRDTKKLLKKFNGVNGVVKELKKVNYNSSNVTSARHTAKKLGISQTKANKLLSNLPGIKRVINVLWVDGCNHYNVDMARLKYPKATVYPLISLDKVKICFGSSLLCVGAESSSLDFSM